LGSRRLRTLPELVGRGAGIVSQPELIEALEKSARKPRQAAARQHLNGYFEPS
jgi:hypothetical protein